MTGTEKQSKWAEDVKEQVVTGLAQYLKRGGVTVEEFLTMDLPDAKIIGDVLAIEDHRFWIDVAAPRADEIRQIVLSPRLVDFGIDRADYGL